jgi:hypothetical protein
MLTLTSTGKNSCCLKDEYRLMLEYVRFFTLFSRRASEVFVFNHTIPFSSIFYSKKHYFGLLYLPSYCF